jgi:hypothetical protein
VQPLPKHEEPTTIIDPLHELPVQPETIIGAGAKTVASEETELGAVLMAAIKTRPYMQCTPLMSVEGVPIRPIGSLGKIVELEKVVSTTNRPTGTIAGLESLQPDGRNRSSVYSIVMNSSFG